MSNNYTHITFRVPVENKEQYEFLEELVSLATSLEDWEDHKREQVIAQHPEYQYFVDSPTWDICIDKHKDAEGEYAWLYCEEASDPWSFGLICREFLKRFKPDGALTFSWADVCSKPILDSPQGGAVFVTAEKIHVKNTFEVRQDFMNSLEVKAINTSEGF